MSNELCQELNLIANNTLEDIKNKLPASETEKLALFIDTLRFLDFINVTSNSNKDINYSRNLEIMKLWWNLWRLYLFQNIGTSWIPVLKSNKDSLDYISKLLFSFWCIITLRRVIDMINTWFLVVTKEDNTYILEKNKNRNLDSQYLDDFEFVELEKLENILNWKIYDYYNGWSIQTINELGKCSNSEWNYLIQNNDFSIYSNRDIEDLLGTQIFSWNSWNGTMVWYTSTPEIDIHYLSKGVKLVNEWQKEAWFHNETKIGNVKWVDLVTIVAFITWLHLKHIDCVLVAWKKYSEVEIYKALTIWTPMEELINSISDFSGIDKMIVTEVFDYIKMVNEDVKKMEKHTSKIIPILFDLGNGMLLRSVSSVFQNPFISIIHILENRNTGFINDLSLNREDWLRCDLYAMFWGNRYITIDGNINIRSNGKVVTDIDAAIFDRISWELALFQIKWQDFHYNDVKKLRSRASNLVKSLDDWATKVEEWIKINGMLQLSQTLRLKLTWGYSINKVILFWISRNASRMEWYWFNLTVGNLAIWNWPQFVKNRFEVWPSEKVFTDLFKILKNQEHKTINTKPFPFEFVVGDKNIILKDIWCTYEDEL